MITITSPAELPYGDLLVTSFSKREEAEKFAESMQAYFFVSNIVNLFYVFVPVKGLQ